MKLVTFQVQTVLGRFSRLGSLIPLGSGPNATWAVVDLNAAAAWLLADRKDPSPQAYADALMPQDMTQFLALGLRSLDLARDAEAAIRGLLKDEVTVPTGFPLSLTEGALVLPLCEDVWLQTPLPKPNLYRDFFAFEQHVKTGFAKRGEEIPEAWYKMPVYYKGNHRSFVGPDDQIPWPAYTQKLDYELELACVIGREGRNIKSADAKNYIAGYTILNDFSARDIQKLEMQVRLGPAKGKDFATAVGPCIVTPDEIGDVKNLKMLARINGQTVTEGNSKTCHWGFDEMIAHASMDEVLYPGDIMGSGTVGNGCALEHDHWLKPGDAIELEIDNIGVLRNTIGEPEKPAHTDAPYYKALVQKS